MPMVVAAVALAINAVVFGVIASISCTKKDKRKQTKRRPATNTAQQLIVPRQSTPPVSSDSTAKFSAMSSPTPEFKVEAEQKIRSIEATKSVNPFKTEEKLSLEQTNEVEEAKTQSCRSAVFSAESLVPESKQKSKRNSVRAADPELKKKAGNPLEKSKATKSAKNRKLEAKPKKEGGKRASAESLGIGTLQTVVEETQVTASVMVNDSEDTNEFIPDLKQDANASDCLASNRE